MNSTKSKVLKSEMSMYISTIVINVRLLFATQIADAGHVGFTKMAGVVVFCYLISCSDMAVTAAAAAAVRSKQQRRGSVRQLRTSAGSVVGKGRALSTQFWKNI